MRVPTIAIVAALSLLSPSRSDLPPIPPLPASGWPLAENAEPFARELIARVPPAQLESMAAADPAIIPAVFRNLGTALLSRDASLRVALGDYATALVLAHAQRIPRAFSPDDIRLLVTFQVIDPLRYGEDEEFRRAVDAILPRSLTPALPEALRRADVAELNRVAPVSFEVAEALAAAAGLVKRRSGERYVDFATARPRVQTTGLDPMEASIFSINSRFATAAEARRLLAAVRKSAPERSIIVLGDDTMRAALGADIARLRIDFIDTFSRPFTLWPRDPFFVARGADGALVFVNRPNLQPGREEDANMVRALVSGLPQSLDARWKARWTTGPTAFHNGQVLLTPGAVWISVHSVEYRALELLGLDRVPVEEFGSLGGIARYVGAVQRASAELSALYARPVRFIHALPQLQPLPEQAALMTTLGGGAGFDLDSVVTLLPRKDGSLEALVGDPSLGRTLAQSASIEEWRAFQKTYGIESTRGSINADAAGLQAFLDRCATDLQAGGMIVRRVPLLMVPGEKDSFFVTWNNVRLEKGRAEGFASGLPAGDRIARAAFARSGYQLELYPPLARSVVLNGGYRCASNEVRAGR